MGEEKTVRGNVEEVFQEPELVVAALAVSIVSGIVPIFEAVRLPPALAFRKVV